MGWVLIIFFGSLIIGVNLYYKEVQSEYLGVAPRTIEPILKNLKKKFHDLKK